MVAQDRVDPHLGDALHTYYGTSRDEHYSRAAASQPLNDASGTGGYPGCHRAGHQRCQGPIEIQKEHWPLCPGQLFESPPRRPSPAKGRAHVAGRSRATSAKMSLIQS